MAEPDFSIAAVERDTGLSKDVLRVWERRYGFPAPARDAHGERRYPAAQVRRLCQIKRLIDQGHRPGRLLALSLEALDALTARAPAADPGPLSAAPDDAVRGNAMGATPSAGAPGALAPQGLLSLVRAHDSEAFVHALQQVLAREGLRRFVQDTVAPLTVEIGIAWERGTLQVFEEHLFTEFTARVLRQALAALPGGPAPRVLLTTLPGEPHALGLLMVEAVLAIEGAHCVSLGTQTPLADIVRAAAAHRADVVALSFSAAFPARQAAGLLAELRAALPPEVALWTGGSGLLRVNAPAGVARLASFEALVSAVEAWRTEALPPSPGEHPGQQEK